MSRIERAASRLRIISIRFQNLKIYMKITLLYLYNIQEPKFVYRYTVGIDKRMFWCGFV